MDQSPTPSGGPERWLPVVDYEGCYEVSDRGRVRSLPRIDPLGRYREGRIRKPWRGSGHHTVRLSRDGKTKTRSVHVLVARAFLGLPPEGHEVCHGPAGYSDNSVANLSYGTRSKNNGADKHRDGTVLLGTDIAHAKLTEEIVWECRIRATEGESYTALAREFGVSSVTINLAVRGIRWRHVAFPDGAAPPRWVKLTDETVRECRERSAAGESFSFIARSFAVSESAVRDAVIGRTWKHVPFPEGAAAARSRGPRLTDEVIRECRERAAAGEPIPSIAHRFLVAPSTVRIALNGHAWRHASRPGVAEPPAA